MNHLFRFHLFYFVLSLLLFLTETGIALFFKEGIIRHQLGDLLVVILLYVSLMTFFKFPNFQTALFVLIFAYVVELLQYLQIVYLLGLHNSPLARLIIGTQFEWADMLAYTLGFLLVIFFEGLYSQKKYPEGNDSP